MTMNRKKTITTGAVMGLLSIVVVWSVHSCQPKTVKTHPSAPIEGPTVPIVPKPPTIPIEPPVVILPPTSVPASPINTLSISTASPANVRCYLLIVTSDQQVRLEDIKCPKIK